MLDCAPAQKTGSSHLQRVRGRAAVSLALKRGETGLTHLSQAGSAKAFLPKTHTPDPEVVFLNTAGGLTGGDLLTYRLELGEGARATATTQTAERAYASPGDAALMEVSLNVGAGARLDWLPQETILFEGSALHRTTHVELAADATVLMCEALVLGRSAMGETLTRLNLFDDRQVWRGGQTVWLEPLTITPAQLADSDNIAGLSGHRAHASIALIGPGAEDAAQALKVAPVPEGVTKGASGWDGRTVCRLSAPDAFPLRRALVSLLSTLRPAAMPRVWQV